MFGRLRIYVLLPLMLLLSLRSASAASVLSICMPGASSHLLNLLRIGRELNQRGHGFDVLVSKEDHILHSLLESRWFDGLKVIKYDGPLGMGTEALGASLSRDLTVRAPHCLGSSFIGALGLLPGKCSATRAAACCAAERETTAAEP